MSKQINTTMTWTKLETKHYLTKYAEGVSVAKYDERMNFLCAKVNSSKWIVMNKHHLNEITPQHPTNFPIPNIVRIYTVEVDAKKQVSKCSCSYKRRTGRPCVHVVSVCDNIHEEMFHPRYYKVYNCEMTFQNEKIQNALVHLRDTEENYPDYVKITSNMQQLLNCNVKFRNGCNEQLKNVMMEGMKMQENGQIVQKHDLNSCLIEHNGIQNREHDGIVMESRIDHICDTDASQQGLRPHITDFREQRHQNNIQNDQKKYATVQSTFKDCTKICEGRPALWNIFEEHMQRAHVELVSAYKDGERNDEDSCMITSSQLVSSNFPIERCPKRKRYKSAWENN